MFRRTKAIVCRSFAFRTAHTEFHYLFKFPRRARKCLNLWWKLRPTFRPKLLTKAIEFEEIYFPRFALSFQTVTQH